MATQLVAVALLVAAVAATAAAEPEVATPPTRKLLFASVPDALPLPPRLTYATAVETASLSTAFQWAKPQSAIYLGEGDCDGAILDGEGYTVDTCAARCRQTSGCNGFSFRHDSTGQCKLSTNGCASRTEGGGCVCRGGGGTGSTCTSYGHHTSWCYTTGSCSDGRAGGGGTWSERACVDWKGYALPVPFPNRCDAANGVTRRLHLPYERAESGHCAAGRRMSREMCSQTARALGQTLRDGTQSYEPYGCWIFEQAGNSNSGQVYWREPGSGDGPNCGGLRDCMCLRQESCTMRPDTSGALGSVSTDTALGYASSAAQCVAKVLRERPDATAVKYGTKTGAHRIESGVCSADTHTSEGATSH